MLLTGWHRRSQRGSVRSKVFSFCTKMLFAFFHYVDICTDGAKTMGGKTGGLAPIKVWHANIIFVFFTTTHLQETKNSRLS